MGVLHISLEKFYKTKVIFRQLFLTFVGVDLIKTERRRDGDEPSADTNHPNIKKSESYAKIFLSAATTRISGQLINTLTKEKHVHVCKCVNV